MSIVTSESIPRRYDNRVPNKFQRTKKTSESKLQLDWFHVRVEDSIVDYNKYSAKADVDVELHVGSNLAYQWYFPSKRHRLPTCMRPGHGIKD